MTMAIFPPSLPRNRRRLRKKLRPPHLYDNVFEMVEDFRDRDRYGDGRERRANGVSSFEVDERGVVLSITI
jgi:hypothetical protein